MISYDPFWKTLKHKGLTGYRLNQSYGVSRSLLDKLHHNRDIRLTTASDLCKILDCRIEDIVEIINED